MNDSSQHKSTEELEREKLIQEIKELKRSNKYSQIILTLTLIISLAGIILPHLSEKEKMTHEEIKLFQELSKDYYERKAKTSLEEQYVLTTRMKMLIENKKEDSLLLAHISTLHDSAKKYFLAGRIEKRQVDSFRLKKKKKDIVTDSKQEKIEEELQQVKKKLDKVTSSNKPGKQAKEQTDSLVKQVQNLQNELLSRDEVIVDSLPVDSISFFTLKSIEIDQKLYSRAEVSENIILNKIHWFKEGYYVALPLDSVEYAVWLDDLDTKNNKIKVSLWKRNIKSGLLEKVTNSDKIIEKGKQTNWTIEAYKINFRFSDIERAGYTRSKAAYFNVKVSIKQNNRPILIPRKH